MSEALTSWGGGGGRLEGNDGCIVGLSGAELTVAPFSSDTMADSRTFSKRFMSRECYQSFSARQHAEV